jgi:hypothetical protein
MKSAAVVIVALGLLVATSAQAQGSSSANKVVPPNMRPPAGMCRIWLDGVPAERQPAPTDCASALRNRPTKGEVIFGDDYAHPDSNRKTNKGHSDDLGLKGVAPLPKSLEPKTPDSTSAPAATPGHKAAKDSSKKSDHRKGGSHRPDSTSTGGGAGIDGVLGSD